MVYGERYIRPTKKFEAKNINTLIEIIVNHYHLEKYCAQSCNHVSKHCLCLLAHFIFIPHCVFPVCAVATVFALTVGDLPALCVMSN